MTLGRAGFAVAVAFLAVACGGPGAPVGPAPVTGQVADTSAMVPAGYGTLRFDDVTMPLSTGPLLIKVTPLSEGILRLLAPDMYQRYHAIAEGKRAEATRATGGYPPEMFVVSFFSYQPDVEYQPEDVQLSHQGRTLQPAAILPVTPSFGRQRLRQQDNQSAVYVFSDPIDYKLSLIVRYGSTQSDAWTSIIQKLEVERSKVRARAGSGSW
jgi:hypothetical protein